MTDPYPPNGHYPPDGITLLVTDHYPPDGITLLKSLTLLITCHYPPASVLKEGWSSMNNKQT